MKLIAVMCVADGLLEGGHQIYEEGEVVEGGQQSLKVLDLSLVNKTSLLTWDCTVQT